MSMNLGKNEPKRSVFKYQQRLLTSLVILALLGSVLPAKPAAEAKTTLASPTIEPSLTQPSSFLEVPNSGLAIISGVIGDPTDPAATLGINFTVDDLEDSAADLTVAATSSNQAVVPNSNLVLSGPGTERNLKITPAGVGGADYDVEITVSVTDTDSNSDSYTIWYAASAGSVMPTTTRFHTGASDASTAIAVSSDYMLVADNEDQMIRLYDRNKSGLPLNHGDTTFDFTDDLEPTDFDGGEPREVDIEASTRIGNRIYWLGSHSNSKSGNIRENRYRLFSTDLTGADAGATLSFVRHYDNLRSDLIQWDIDTDQGLKLADSAAEGVPPEEPKGRGFNIEGFALAPGSTTTAYIAFRAPITLTKGLIVPITNLPSLVTDPPAASSATFGDPIKLDLGGCGIRGIERNANDEYLIIAGPAGGPGEPEACTGFALYTWTGDAMDAPTPLPTDLSALQSRGSFEGIVDLPSPLPLDGSQPIQLLVDNGDTDWYDNGTRSKDLSESNYQKFRTEWVTLGAAPPAGDQVVVNNNDSGPGSLRQAIADVGIGGTITFDASLTGATITLISGALTIDKDMTIDAAAAPGLVISGNDADRVFFVDADTTAMLRNLTVRDGNTSSGGGGVLNEGTLIIVNSTIADNTADWGGGIENSGTLTMRNSTLSGNQAVGEDPASSGGGGFDQYDEFAVTTIVYSTITNNSTPNVTARDGIWLEAGALNISNSIVAGNGGATANCTIEGGSSFVPTGENIDDGTSCTGFSASSTDPMLGPLADNGGPSPTHALLTGSPAVDAATCGDATTDQRGTDRPQGTACDIGAFELKSMTTNGGLIFFPAVMSPRRPARAVVPFGSVWKYYDKGPIPGTDWRAVSFDDSAWQAGPAQLGYGDGDEVTKVSYGSDLNNKNIATYFRHAFTVSDPSAYKTLDLQLLRDDGAVVYLNGEEVLRSNMPTGDITPSVTALTAIGGDGEKKWTHASIFPAQLVPGKNVLAVEIHQANPTSSDISFDLELTRMRSDGLRFAVIGDYGLAGKPEQDVANLAKSWLPDLVITLGDNNYPDGSQGTINANIDNYYGEFMAAGSFFPSLGNHDWHSITCAGGACSGPYLSHFSLPGNERYYDFVRGSVHFFVLDSDPHEPRGNTLDSIQATWLRDGLASATEPWKIVYFHHAPYSSANHGPNGAMQWPFAAWGASAVLAGHDHTYERLEKDGIPYFVNGLSGTSNRYSCGVKDPQATVTKECFRADHGAILVEADECQMMFSFITTGTIDPAYRNKVYDTYTLNRCQQ
jgi:hypothetical protein